MSVLENQIPTLPISSENVYYTDIQKNTKTLNIYLNNIDIFKEQMLLILQNINKDIKNLQDTAVTDPIALPIIAADVNYTKPDESTVQLDTYLENIINDIQTLEEKLEDYLPKVPYKEQIDDYLPVFPKFLCTNSSTSTLSSTKYSLFNFYNVENSGNTFPEVTVNAHDGPKTLFKIDRNTNDIQVGTFVQSSVTEGTVQVGGYNLELYYKNKFTLKNSYLTNTITSDNINFQISSSSGSSITFKYGSAISHTNTNLELTGSDTTNKIIISNGINLLTEDFNLPLTIKSTKFGKNKEIIIPYDMKFEVTDNYLTITAKTQLGLTKTARISWQ
jgi:hypothetical protein